MIVLNGLIVAPPVIIFVSLRRKRCKDDTDDHDTFDPLPSEEIGWCHTMIWSSSSMSAMIGDNAISKSVNTPDDFRTRDFMMISPGQ